MIDPIPLHCVNQGPHDAHDWRSFDQASTGHCDGIDVILSPADQIRRLVEANMLEYAHDDLLRIADQLDRSYL